MQVNERVLDVVERCPRSVTLSALITNIQWILP